VPTGKPGAYWNAEASSTSDLLMRRRRGVLCVANALYRQRLASDGLALTGKAGRFGEVLKQDRPNAPARLSRSRFGNQGKSFAYNIERTRGQPQVRTA